MFFVNPDSSAKAYQGLATVYSAIEPPTWALLLAESSRSNRFGVGILDCDAERLSLEQSVRRIEEIRPRLIVFVVYGQNPNSGTTSMIGALALARALKDQHPEFTICFVGSHTSALPMEVLAYDCVDIVLLNEGVTGLVVVSIFPRWNFLLSAISQLVNHLDKVQVMSSGGYKAKAIIRTGIGSERPLHPQYQHVGDYTEAIQAMCTTIEVIRLKEAADIFPAYEKALLHDDGRSTILVEYGDFYSEK